MVKGYSYTLPGQQKQSHTYFFGQPLALIVGHNHHGVVNTMQGFCSVTVNVTAFISFQSCINDRQTLCIDDESDRCVKSSSHPRDSQWGSSLDYVVVNTCVEKIPPAPEPLSQMTNETNLSAPTRSYSLHHLGLENMLKLKRISHCSNYPMEGSFLFALLNPGGDFFG